MRVSIQGDRFNSREFVAKLEHFVEKHPEKAIDAYTNAANKLRNEAEKDLTERVHLQALAMRLDQLAEGAAEIEETILGGTPDDGLGNHEFSTDWADTIEDVAAAKVDAEGRPRSEFAAVAALHRTWGNRSNNSNGNTNSNSTFRLVPASLQNGTTNLGSSLLCKFGATTATTGSYTDGTTGSGITTVQEGQVIRWDGREFEESIPVTLTFASPGCVFPIVNYTPGTSNSTVPTYTPFAGATYRGFDITLYPTNALAIFRPFGHLIWGTSKGVPNEIYFDIGTGIQFTIVAAFVYCNVGMSYKTNLKDSLDRATVPGSMMLSGSMGFYTTNRNTPLTLTIANIAIGRLIAIPPFARTIEAFYTTNPSIWKIIFQNNLGDFMGYLDLKVLASRSIPIPNEAISISTNPWPNLIPTNPAQFDADNGRCVFGLGI